MLRATTALALIAAPLAAPAWALTPEELWATWQAQAASFGVTLTADATPGEGGALVLRNWRGGPTGGLSLPLPSDSPVTELTLVPTADGAVRIESDLAPVVDIPSADSSVGTLHVETRGLSILARDGAGVVAYEVAAESVKLANAPVASEFYAPADFAAEVVGLAASFPGGIPTDGAVTVALSADGLAYLTDSTGGQQAEGLLGIGSRTAARTEGRLGLAVTATLPQGIDLATIDTPAEAVAALDAGAALRVEATNEAFEQASWSEGFPFSYSYTSRGEPARFALAFDRAGLRLDGGYGALSATVAVPDSPVPSFDVGLAGASTLIDVPLAAGGGEFRYQVALRDLTVGEPAWAYLDPEGRLPRDPLAFEVDVGGRAAIDLAGFVGAMEAGTEPAIPSIESLEVRTLTLSAAGLRATGAGSFTFSGPPEAPIPSGTATARIEGLDRLIDAGVALGWVSADQASQARLALAVAFRATGETDVRVLDLEARPDGSVFLNGVQVQ